MHQRFLFYSIKQLPFPVLSRGAARMQLGLAGDCGKALALDRLGAASRRNNIVRYITTQPLRVRANSQHEREEKKRIVLVSGAGAAVSISLVPTILVSGPGSVEAVTAADIAGTFNKAQEFTNQATSVVGSAYATVAGVLQQVYTLIKPAVDVAFPFAQKTTDAAIKAAVPVASNVASEAVKALQNAGVDTKPVGEAAKTAVTLAGEAAEETGNLIEGAKPFVSRTLDFLLSADPLTLAGEGGALVLLYFLTPSILSSLGYAARGYKGDLTAPQTLDLLSNENYTLIDVRTEKEKSKSGIPSLPNNAKKKFVAIPIEEFPGKLRSQLRNARAVEAEVAAIKISALKTVNKGSKIIILDSVGNIAKTVAKSLSGLGFKNTWIVSDGFDGGRGWVQNRLGTESYNLSLAEVFSPSRIIPATTKLFKTTSSSDSFDSAPRYNKLLPSGSED